MKLLNSKSAKTIIILRINIPVTGSEMLSMAATLESFLESSDQVLVLPKGVTLQYLSGTSVPVSSLWPDGRLVYDRSCIP